MYKSVKIFMIAMLAGTLLTGCQRSLQQPVPLAETQVAQLSSVVAAASWLRDRCNRKDIASNDVLTLSALEQAQKRGWNTHQAAYQQLDNQIAEHFQALTTDSVGHDEKCAGLNRTVARFLQHSQFSQ